MRSTPETHDKRLMIFGIVAAMVIVAGVVTAMLINRSSSGKLSAEQADALASCLSEKGAKMYGASWCGHCQRQKKEFGAAVSKLPYVECADDSAPNGQAKICADEGIKSYPTWVFADGSRQSGEMTLAELASKAGCPFIEGVAKTPPPTTVAPVAAPTSE